jgi:hypothetical protein
MTTPEKELNKIRKEKHNMTCADCPEKNKEWGFGAVVVKYKSFVCNLCKQVSHGRCCSTIQVHTRGREHDDS